MAKDQNKKAAKAENGEPNKQPRKLADWERIELDYRAGLLSVREVGAKHGISHTAISKRAKAEGWERDLNAKVKAKADALVAKREVSKTVTTEKLATERQLIEATAQVIADVRMTQRGDIKRFRDIAMNMLAELEHETNNVDLFEQLGDMLRSDDDKGQDKRNDLYQKVISSAGRIDSLKKLADTLKTLVTLEREAYGLATGGADPVKPVAADSSLSPEDAYKRMLG